MDEEAVMEFFDILDEWNIDFDEIGLSYDDLSEMDADDLNNILAQLEPEDDDEEEY